MLTGIVFAAVGLIGGFVLRLPGFTILMVGIVVAYWIILAGMNASGEILAVVTAAIAMQVGYFLAVLVRIAAAKRRL
jgi:hypothetical protein